MEKTITVKLKYIPEQEDKIEVKISQNDTVSDLKKAFTDKLKKVKGDKFDNFISENPIGLLKLGKKGLTDEKQTLNEAGIENDSVIQNENRVFLFVIYGDKKIGVTCNENTTLKEFLKNAINKIDLKNGTLVRFVFAGKQMNRQCLNYKLFDLKRQNPSVYGLSVGCVPIPEKPNDYDTVFNLQKLGSNEEELKKAWAESQKSKAKFPEELSEANNATNGSSDYWGQRFTSPARKRQHRQNNWPLARKMIGIIDLILLAAAITTFVLDVYLVVPIVLAALFVFGAYLFLRWNSGWPKILPKSWLPKKIDLETYPYKENEHGIKETENDQKDNPEKKDEKEEEYNTL